MDTFITREGNIVVDSQGRFLIPAAIPSLSFAIESTQFPPTGHTDRAFSFGTKSLPQTVYIDFGDGSEVFEEAFSATTWSTAKYLNNNLARVLKTYPDASRKIVKIWFKYPEKISDISITTPGIKMNVVGSFPLNIGLYNLLGLSLSGLNFDAFPTQLSGGNYYALTLENITALPINYIPKWIYNSKITELSLKAGLDFSNLAVSNLDKLINIQGLQHLYINSANITVNSIPDNLKDIPTLRTISFGNSDLKEVPVQFNNCKQITELAMGYRAGRNNAGGNPNIVAWGIGISNMPNLRIFSADMCGNVSVEVVTGIETANLNTYQTSGCYNTVERVDQSIISCLNKVATFAIMVVGSSLLRNITWDNRGAIPTGVFEAPPNFVLGSSNGDVQTAMQAVYVLCKQYRWTVKLNVAAGNNITFNYLT